MDLKSWDDMSGHCSDIKLKTAMAVYVLKACPCGSLALLYTVNVVRLLSIVLCAVNTWYTCRDAAEVWEYLLT